MYYNELFTALQNLTDKKVSQSKIAEILGLGASAIGNRASRNAEFKQSEIKLIEEYYNVSLLSGNSPENIELDYIHINPSCGRGTTLLHDAEITPISIGKNIIKDIWRISDPQCLKIFKASGDSMNPIIEDGDLMLIDTARTDFNNGGIFLLTINNDWYIKRLRKRLSGELDVISDNTNYPIETFSQDDFTEIVIKGRVIKNLSRGL